MNWKDNLPALARECGLEKVILFGSRARGDHRARSDIDWPSAAAIQFGSPCGRRMSCLPSSPSTL